MRLFFNQISIATKSTIRNFRKNRIYSSLNLLGLAIAYATIILVVAYSYQETSYENFHTKADRIYRPTHHFQGENDFEIHFARVPVNFINELPEAIPEIEHLIRFHNKEKKYVRIGEKRFKPKWAYTTDAAVFDVFDLPLLQGNPETALANPNSVVLSESTAKKYFSHTDVIGKEIYITGDFDPEERVFRVTGVLKDLPVNTHLPIDILFSFPNEEARTGWAYIYTLLKPGVDITTVEAKLPEFIAARTDSVASNQITFEFQALKDIHLHSHLAREIKPNGQEIYIRIFVWVAIFVWLIALVNFANLSTALTLARGKEIGVRKVLGANNNSLTIFSLTEAVVYSFVTLLLGTLIAWLYFPSFSLLTGIAIWPPLTWFILGMTGLALFTGLLAGILPSLVMASIGILQIMKGGNNWSMKKETSKINVRRIMITLQFAATIILIGSALVAHRQFSFIQNMNLGIQQEQILTISEVPEEVKRQYQVFKNRLLESPGISAVTACMQMPSTAIRDVGPVNIRSRGEEQSAPMMDMQIIEPNFTEMMGMELLAGNDLSLYGDMKPYPEFNEDLTPADYLNSAPRQYLINETAMKQLGWQSPDQALGQEINWSIGPYQLAYGPVAGVFKDYHQESLKSKIDPLVMCAEPLWVSNYLIKVGTNDIENNIAAIEKIWTELFPYPFEYSFLDERFNQLYQQDRVQLKLLSALSFIAILLSFLGVISLVAYALERRSKELAIRRVIGANLRDLVRLMGKEYFWVLSISAVIGIPVSYYFVSQWLQNFAYRIVASPLEYLLTLVFIFALLIFTIYAQTFRATVENPVERLREE